MAAWKLSEAAVRLRREIDALFPGRDTTSDGSIGDSAHAARESDHNPDRDGWVRAIDVDEDLWGARFPDPAFANRLVRKLVAVAKTDKRLKYIIFEGFMWSEKTRWQKWAYGGSNQHEHHIHISFNPVGDEDGSPFGLVTDLQDAVAEARPTPKKRINSR